MRLALLALTSVLVPSASVPQTLPASAACSAPVAVPQTPSLAANSTYYSDGLPPVRFRKNGQTMVRFSSQASIDAKCGKAPCYMVTLGCQWDNPRLMILPNPCGYGAADAYASLVCHELGHLNGWPATHGD